MVNRAKSPDAIRILIVDDIEDTRKNIGIILSFERDFTVVGPASDGQEAIDMAVKLQPDVILMDINMPVMNGLEATEQLTDVMPRAVIVILSAMLDLDVIRQAMIAGARDFVEKPPDPDVLYVAIRRACLRHRRYYPRMREAILAEERSARSGDTSGLN